MAPQGYRPQYRNETNRRAGSYGKRRRDAERSRPALSRANHFGSRRSSANAGVVDVDDRSGETLDVRDAKHRALVSRTTNEGADAVGFGGESGNQRIVIDRRKRVENEGDSLHGTKPETVARGRIRVTQNPEDAGQKHAAVCGMNGAQHAVARHVP